MQWLENGSSTVQFYCSCKKKNIFLIGDSIRRGYCATVREALQEKAEVFYVDDNCRSTQYVIFSLKKWAALFNDPSLVDVVHFNCGQWDVAHWNGHPLPLTSEDEYEKNIGIIIDLIRHFFPNARLIFATTSPMNPNGTSGVNPRTNKAVDRYNSIAVRVANDKGVAVNDINAFMRPWESTRYTDLCHLTREAFADLGLYVADFLFKYMEEEKML